MKKPAKVKRYADGSYKPHRRGKQHVPHAASFDKIAKDLNALPWIWAKQLAVIFRNEAIRLRKILR